MPTQTSSDLEMKVREKAASFVSALMVFAAFAPVLAVSARSTCQAKLQMSGSGVAGNGRGRFHAQPLVLQAGSGPLKGEGENLTCFQKHGPSHAMEVGRIHISMPGDGGHHVILFRPHPGPVQWPPKLCPLTLNWDQWELIAQTQHPELDWQLPPGVAINISRRQPLLVQTHYGRARQPNTRHAMTKTKLYPIDPATVTAHAGALFLNDRSMVVPPHTTMTEANRCTITGEGNQGREGKLL